MYNYIKGDYMNKKGFTLTELIVTIALIGIISMLAFPSIRKLKEDNSLEKYKTYEKVMENGAKLYVDSNKSDLFQYYHHKIITYDMLMDKKLIEAFEDEKVGNAVAVPYLADTLWDNNEFVGSIVGIQEKNYNRAFTARAYVKLDDGTYLYSATTTTKTVADIADAYIANSSEAFNALDATTKELVQKWADANN